MHQSPMQYVTQCRMRRAMTLLRSEQLPIAAVATRVGYSSEAALSAAFVRHVGLPPGLYRRSSQQRDRPSSLASSGGWAGGDPIAGRR